MIGRSALFSFMFGGIEEISRFQRFSDSGFSFLYYYIFHRLSCLCRRGSSTELEIWGVWDSYNLGMGAAKALFAHLWIGGGDYEDAFIILDSI